MSRYRFKTDGDDDLRQDPSFETKDTALIEVRKFAKKEGNTYLWDSHDTPHRCIGLATRDGEWLPPVATCKTCKGKRMAPNTYGTCNDCRGLGCILQKPRWKPS